MVIGALDTECGGTKMNHQTIASGHIFPVKSFYESSLAQYREANVSGTIKASGGVAGGGSETFLSQPIPIHDQATRHAGKNGDKTMGKGNGLGIGQPGDPMNTLTKGDNHAVAYAFDSLSSNSMKSSNPNSGCREVDLAKTIDTFDPNPSKNQGGIGVMQSMAVRRLTPTECERLQGFPDGYTNIPWRKAAESPDGPRYKALGNSWAVPVVAWLGQRIKDQLQ
jgi:site-specific DNA-cytosine methylase